MPKYVKLFEDAMEPLTGGGADLFKSYIDTKNAFIEDEHAVDDPKAGGIGQVNYHYDVPAPGYLDGTMDTGGKIKEDTTNPPASQQKDGEELLANDDLSNFALPLTNNESQSPKLKRKFGKVMGEFKDKKLKTSAGKTVTNPKQAAAIAYSEAGESKNEGVEIFRFEQFVNEKYGPEQEKMEKNKQKAVKALVSKADKTSGQKKVTAIRKKITKSVSESHDDDDYGYVHNGPSYTRKLNKDDFHSSNPYKSEEEISKDQIKRDKERKAQNVRNAEYDVAADNAGFDKDAAMKHDTRGKELEKIAAEIKDGGYDDGPNVKLKGENDIHKWVMQASRKLKANMEDGEGEPVDKQAYYKFIANDALRFVRLFWLKYKYVNQGIFDAFVLQNFND